MQPHSLQLKFIPTPALINLASCGLNAVYNENIAANGAQTLACKHARAFPRERTSEEAPGQHIPRRTFVVS